MVVLQGIELETGIINYMSTSIGDCSVLDHAVMQGRDTAEHHK